MSNFTADTIEIFFLGMLGTILLGIIGFVIYLLFTNLLIVGYIAGCLLFIYVVGWCIKNADNFATLVKSTPKVKAENSTPGHENVVLDGLQKLETKYDLTTVKFMGMVMHGFRPYGMDNLDYMEWIALTNELPSIINRERDGE